MEHEDAHPRFYAFYLIVIGLINALDYSATLITMYLCYEFMTLCSLPLVLHSLTKEAISAGLKYLFYSIAGAMMALFGFFCMYAYANTLDFTPGGVMDSALLAGHEPLFLAGVFAVLIGLCTKAGMFPMHAWLPTAHPIAPAPASAQLSAVITKAGVLCVIRTVFFIAGADRIAGTWVQYTWIILTLITIFMGSMMAYRERELRRMQRTGVHELSLTASRRNVARETMPEPMRKETRADIFFAGKGVRSAKRVKNRASSEAMGTIGRRIVVKRFENSRMTCVCKSRIY